MRTLTIFRKELVDIIRDKRTIITMVIVPLLVVPVLLTIVINVSQRQQEKAEAKVARVAVLGEENAPELYQHFVSDSAFELRSAGTRADVERLIREDSLDGAVVIPVGFEQDVEQDRRASLEIYFRSSSSFNVTERRLREVIDTYDEQIVAGRIERLGLDQELFDAVEIQPNDVASLKEVLGKTVGGFLPYMFVLFMFTGAMYPGIDLGAGEKERGTLETLLSSPASRLEIVVGKFLVVSLVGLMSAAISMLGLYLGVRGIGDIPREVLDVVGEILNLRVVGMVLTLLIPLAAFFGATILAISIQAKSFKEAQSSLTPLSILIIVPVALGLLPGMELNATTALVPILNVSLATKEVIAGTVDPVHLGLAYLSLFGLAALSLWFAASWFSREDVLFRT